MADSIVDGVPTTTDDGLAAREPRLDSDTSPVVGPEHRKLHPFIGNWTVVGENAADAPTAPNTKVTGEQSFVWLPGGFFLLGHWDHRFENGRHLGIHIIRFDAATREYSSYNVDNLGFARTYRVTPNDDAWSFTGDRERATMRFGEDGRTLTIDWELTKDGLAWLPLCHLEATRT